MTTSAPQVDESLRRVRQAAELNAADARRWQLKLAVLRERDRRSLGLSTGGGQ
ncbi:MULTISPECIES: hypothetical protein [unclassified Kitasatospora]|uniref:hypothetical protein n=1 Tax=unclassified Kitasatospora TaxID=2633591 RepID=UPI000B16954D|nr:MULTISPECIES: hypothetical protein [unclassified Kitasatospora]